VPKRLTIVVSGYLLNTRVEVRVYLISKIERVIKRTCYYFELLLSIYPAGSIIPCRVSRAVEGEFQVDRDLTYDEEIDTRTQSSTLAARCPAADTVILARQAALRETRATAIHLRSETEVPAAQSEPFHK